MLYRLIAYLPFPLLYALAYVVYLLLYHVFRYRRAVVKQNLERAFPDKSSAERQRIGRNFYRHLSRVAMEILKARRMKREDFLERVPLQRALIDLKRACKRFRWQDQPDWEGAVRRLVHQAVSHAEGALGSGISTR